jgi:tetratricopeptide (TPR) repeat protein
VLLLTLGNVYWDSEKYSDAQRCYGEAIGLLDKDRKDYEQLSARSKVLDELTPHTSAVELQDSLQRLAKMPEEQLNKVIDKLIEALIKKEKEEKRKQQEAETEQRLQEEEAKNGNTQTASVPTPTMPGTGQSGQWYFYNPQAVSQGKQAFQRQWGKRQNQDNWQRVNQTVVNMNMETPESQETAEGQEMADSLATMAEAVDSVATETPEEAADSSALDPHKREYYLAQIPFTEEQLTESNNLLKDGLFHSGIIFKDKLDNLGLSEKALKRLTDQFADYEHNDEAWYHLYLLYSRQGRTAEAERCLAMLKQDFAESDWTTLLSDPNFMENQRFGVHIEDSVYAATYEAFKAGRYDEVKANAAMTATRFPLGEHRAKFLFVEGLTLLNEGDAKQCTERMKQVVEQYPQNEISEMAGMILRGVQQGRQLHGGKFDIDDIWSRRTTDFASDSTQVDTLTLERHANYVFMLVYQPDSINQNQLLFEMAKHNFSNYMVRNFDIAIEQDPLGLARMLISGFLSYDEVHQYASQLYADSLMAQRLRPCRSIIISEKNLPLLGTAYSYRDYEVFYQQQLEPITVVETPLLDQPETIIRTEEDDDVNDNDNGNDNPNENGPQTNADDDILPAAPQQSANSSYPEFDDDFWR